MLQFMLFVDVEVGFVILFVGLKWKSLWWVLEGRVCFMWGVGRWGKGYGGEVGRVCWSCGSDCWVQGDVFRFVVGGREMLFGVEVEVCLLFVLVVGQCVVCSSGQLFFLSVKRRDVGRGYVVKGSFVFGYFSQGKLIGKALVKFLCQFKSS